MFKSVLIIYLFLPILLFATDLESIFHNPPESAKPRGYWVWPHGNFDYDAIRFELKQFKEKGLGGVDIFDLGISDRKNVIPAGPAFMSPEQVDGIAFALDEAKKLDLKMGLIVSSSWNAGAAWTPPEQAAMNLVASVDTIRGPITLKKMPFPALPDSFYKSYGTFALNVPRDENGMPEYFKDVATLLFPLSDDGTLVNLEQVQILDEPDVDVEVPAGRWVIMRTVCTNFGQMLWVPSKNSNGLTIDHFSKEAVTDHFLTIINRLEKRCGPLDETALERLYLASYESNAEIIWTPTMSHEFITRNGYPVEAFLPALFGFTVENENITERFLYDFRKTVSDIFVENLYRNARDICHEHGLKICSEAGGPGAPLHDVPTEDLKALGAIDVMRGEFWVDKRNRLKPDGFEELQIVKGIASAAHIYGHNIVEMEAFTSHDNWRQSPATLKPFADRAFCEGMSRVVYHTMTHNLPEAGKPGWTFGAGTHINTNTTWWELSEVWHSYLARCSAMLQQGQFVADVCYYYGHEIPNFTQPKHARPGLGLGYDYDDINTEVLLKAFIEDGRLTLPSGMSYAVLVLPDDERMDLAVLKKIRQLLQDGATIIGPKPTRVYGLANYEKEEAELKTLADELWGKKHRKKLDKKIGDGRLIVGQTPRDILMNMNIGPDVEFFNAPTDTTFDFIHRRTDEAEIYFIRNSTAQAQTAEGRFRVHDRQPEQWNPVNGNMQTGAIFTQDKNGIRLQLHLDPHGSIFIVFQKEQLPLHVVRVGFEGTQLFPSRSLCDIQINAIVQNHNIDFMANAAGEYAIELNDGTTFNVTNPETETVHITGAWEVRFPFGWEATPLQKFEKLISWTDANDPGTRAFSGTATYKKSFVFDGNLENKKTILDLGDVKEICQVYLNGQNLGFSCFEPHKFDVSGILRVGENYLIVNVANTWLNRLIEDDKRPESERLTHTNLTRGPTSATAWRQATPKESGLLGPVTLSIK